MPKKPQTPLDKILYVKTMTRLYLTHEEHALGGETVLEFMVKVDEVLGYLMDFRNMVNAMASLDEDPSQAVLPYLSNDALDAASLYRTSRDG